MALAQEAEIPELSGAEAAAITESNNQYIFRMSFGQQTSMPKIAHYIHDVLEGKEQMDLGQQRIRQGRP